MTKNEIFEKMETLKEVFDVVRLVDVTRAKVIRIRENGETSEEEYQCFSIWNQEHRCDNCVSAQAFASKGEVTKFEFREDQVFFILAKYIVAEDMPLVLEMGKIVNSRTLFGAYEKNEFIDKITLYNKKIYHDALTGCYNRWYYEEQLAAAGAIAGAAVVDIDGFKAINDTYGHNAGDEVLKALSAIMIGSVRPEDSVIRMGGDEFVIAFQDISQELLYEKLNALRMQAEAVSIPEYPDLHVTLSIGGVLCDQFHDGVLQMADELLYEAKKDRNTVIVRTVK